MRIVVTGPRLLLILQFFSPASRVHAEDCDQSFHRERWRSRLRPSQPLQLRVLLTCLLSRIDRDCVAGVGCIYRGTILGRKRELHRHASAGEIVDRVRRDGREKNALSVRRPSRSMLARMLRRRRKSKLARRILIDVYKPKVCLPARCCVVGNLQYNHLPVRRQAGSTHRADMPKIFVRGKMRSLLSPQIYRRIEIAE